MKDILNNLISEMIEYEKGNPRRVQHFLKVHAFAKIIAEQEGLDERTRDTLEIAAVLHDIGIKHKAECEKIWLQCRKLPGNRGASCGSCSFEKI